MIMTTSFISSLFVLCILFILLLIFIRFKIKDTGYTIIDDMLSKSDIDYISKEWENRNFKTIYNLISDIIKDKLNRDNYELIDYMYVIENSSIHTYHRDYTSSKNYNNLRYPSYTMILYLDDNNSGLHVIPKSHLDNSMIYLFDYSLKLNVKKGSVIIFDANLLHCGDLYNNKKRKCIQFKIIHKDDISKVPHLQNFHVLINNQNNKIKFLKKIEMNFTRHFPIITDLFNSIIKNSFGEKKTFIQKMFSKLIFSNSDFYKPIKLF